MLTVPVTITAFIDPSNPGFVECTFTDAWGTAHLFQEKVPIVTRELLDEKSVYPTQGGIACTLIRAWKDEVGRDLMRVTTLSPWGVESVEGQFEFDLLASILV